MQQENLIPMIQLDSREHTQAMTTPAEHYSRDI
jgi:hypothetical protein